MKIMLDLETLSSEPNAAIVAIGAVGFSETEVFDHRTFYQAVTPKSLGASGLHISADTFAWWCQQSDDARKVFSDPQAMPLAATLSGFAAWCKDQGVDEMWGNGADFDCVVLGNAYRRLEKYAPWKYSQNRCFRTLKSLVPVEFSNARWVAHSAGLTHHNALDDAIRQARMAVDFFNVVRGYTIP